MMTLWGRKSSINVQKVLWVLAELGLQEGADFKQIDAGLHFGINKTPEYLKLNPNGLVPSLEDGSLVLWESNTIMRYLAKKFSSTGAFPDDLASQASSDKWMDWQISTLWPSLRVPFLGLTLVDQAFCSGYKFNLGDITIALCVKRWIMLADQYPDKTGPRTELIHLKRWYEMICANTQFTKATE
jgi:glutathione S-transferase